MSDELMYQLIFALEDQAREYLLDLAEGVPVQADFVRCSAEERTLRYRDLPRWTPADGFRIMEKFVSSLKNPVFREKLREALGQGRGVFRSFKNTLKEEPAVERLWFYFKEREIKRVIYIWYEQLTEISYLESLGEPEQETSELILSDFVVGEGIGPWMETIRQIGKERLEPEFASAGYPLSEQLLQECRGWWARFQEDRLVIRVEAPGGDFAGFIAAEMVSPDGNARILSVRELYVEPRYRGLGIFKLLLDELCSRADASQADRVVIEVRGKTSAVIPALLHRGFVPYSESFALDPARWRQSLVSDDEGHWV